MHLELHMVPMFSVSQKRSKTHQYTWTFETNKEMTSSCEIELWTIERVASGHGRVRHPQASPCTVSACVPRQCDRERHPRACVLGSTSLSPSTYASTSVSVCKQTCACPRILSVCPFLPVHVRVSSYTSPSACHRLTLCTVPHNLCTEGSRKATTVKRAPQTWTRPGRSSSTTSA